MAKATRVTVLAFDPGGSTGIAYFRAIRGGDEYFNTEYGCDTLGPEEHHSALWERISKECAECEELHLVFESFEYRNKSRAGLNLISREYIGIIKLYVEKFATRDFVSNGGAKIVANKQMPATAMGFVEDNNLRKMKLWKPGDAYRHEMDAYRHLFWYLIHKAKIMPQEFLRAGWK